MTSSSVDIDMDIWNFYMFCHCIGVIFTCHITSMVNGISCSSKTNKYMRVIFINFESQSIWLWVASLLQKTSDDRNLAKYSIFKTSLQIRKLRFKMYVIKNPFRFCQKINYCRIFIVIIPPRRLSYTYYPHVLQVMTNVFINIELSECY